MQGDLLQVVVEDAHQAAVPARPDVPGQVLRRHRVVGALDLDGAVAVHHTPRLLEAGEALDGQRLQGGAFAVGEVGADLPAGGAVQARVGHRPLPVEQEVGLFIEAGGRPALWGGFLGVVDAAFEPSPVAGGVTPGGGAGA